MNMKALDKEIFRICMNKSIKDFPLYSSNFKIDGYSIQEIGMRCQNLYAEGYFSDFEPLYGDNKICNFVLGTLTEKGSKYAEELLTKNIIVKFLVWEKQNVYIKFGALIVGTLTVLATLINQLSNVIEKFLK